MAEKGEKRDPKSHRTPTQIKRMDRTYNSRPDMIERRQKNNEARALMEKKLGKAAVAGKDIDHKKPLRHGGVNSPSNLRVLSKSRNRGWADGKR